MRCMSLFRVNKKEVVAKGGLQARQGVQEVGAELQEDEVGAELPEEEVV